MPHSRSRRRGRLALSLSFTLMLAGALPALAQEGGLGWNRGPGLAPIGENLAEMDVPPGYMWLDGEATQVLMELMENPINGTEVATVTSVAEDEDWYLVFEWDDIGYVKDDEGGELDADAMLASLREGNELANEERRRRGWGTIDIVGWHERPHYDPLTNNLTWALIGEADGERIINRNIRILGRRGVMSVTQVSAPEELAAVSARVDRLLEGYRYRPGSRYAEFVPGKDRLAEIGLTALVVGGAGALAVKSGFLARFWKLLVAGVVAVAAGVKRLFGRGRADESLAGAERAGVS